MTHLEIAGIDVDEKLDEIDYESKYLDDLESSHETVVIAILGIDEGDFDGDEENQKDGNQTGHYVDESYEGVVRVEWLILLELFRDDILQDLVFPFEKHEDG